MPLPPPPPDSQAPDPPPPNTPLGDNGPLTHLPRLEGPESFLPDAIEQPPLKRPIDLPPAPPGPRLQETTPLVQPSFDAPLGFTGPSGVLPGEIQTDPHFVPMPDRWRIGFPDWDRYPAGTTADADAPYQQGHWWDPFNQNVLKGDYPILGQNTFFVLTAESVTLYEPRQVPVGTTGFESTARPFEEQFFGRPNQALASQTFFTSLEFFQGDASFRPVDWRIKVTPAFNFNYVDFDELAAVNPDVRKGTDRARTYLSLQEWFVENKLADLSPNYDFVSVRAGSQPFNSDFRGFIFTDTNRAVRIFGNLDSNREQFNLIYFDQLEKDTDSTLNTFRARNQQVLIGN